MKIQEAVPVGPVNLENLEEGQAQEAKITGPLAAQLEQAARRMDLSENDFTKKLSAEFKRIMQERLFEVSEALVREKNEKGITKDDIKLELLKKQFKKNEEEGIYKEKHSYINSDELNSSLTKDKISTTSGFEKCFENIYLRYAGKNSQGNFEEKTVGNEKEKKIIRDNFNKEVEEIYQDQDLQRDLFSKVWKTKDEKIEQESEDLKRNLKALINRGEFNEKIIEPTCEKIKRLLGEDAKLKALHSEEEKNSISKTIKTMIVATLKYVGIMSYTEKEKQQHKVDRLTKEFHQDLNTIIDVHNDKFAERYSKLQSFQEGSYTDDKKELSTKRKSFVDMVKKAEVKAANASNIR